MGITMSEYALRGISADLGKLSKRIVPESIKPLEGLEPETEASL